MVAASMDRHRGIVEDSMGFLHDMPDRFVLNSGVLGQPHGIQSQHGPVYISNAPHLAKLLTRR